MKKKLFFAAVALVALASCSENDFVGDQTVRESNENAAISLGSSVTAITRADKTGSDAATDLNGQFYVYGIKNESSDGAGSVGTGNLVFKNYVVKWVDNSANTTTSNTKGWEYVGYTLTEKERTHVTANSGDAVQTIKYWDYGASDYTFYAFSANPEDIEGEKITVTKVQNKKATDDPAHTFYDNGYTVSLTAEANLDKLFFAERVNITDINNYDRMQTNKYGGNVTFRFHNVVSKVRVGMYETIPGYTVTINKFSVDNDGDNPAFSEMTDDVTANFAANLQYYASGIAGTMNVAYVASGTNQNYPIVSFSPTGGTKANVLALGTGLKEGVIIGETAIGATYDTADNPETTGNEAGAYTRVYPNEGNTQNLKLKLSYTLTAPVTGETIVISNKTAEIPAKYLQWKSGYAYTYLFKITDDDLYPITFDAVEITSEDGVAEYITTVSEPSITTFGVKGGKYTSGKNDYEAGSDIYATFMDGSSVVDFTLGTNVNVYLATTADATNYPITEASVAESLAEISSGVKKITTELKNTDGSTSFTAVPVKVTTVPGEDGVDKTINALKLTGAVATSATTALVVEYIKTPATYHTSSGTYSLADESAFNTEISTHGKLYTDAATTNELTWSVYNTNAESRIATYYRRTSVNSVGEYAYKVIRVVAAPEP